MRRTTAFWCVLAASLGVAHAEHPKIPTGDDWTVVLEGQLRDRLLVDSGRDFVDEMGIDREYITQRARLGISVKHASGTVLTVRLQDVRIWGEETNTLNDSSADGFDAHEAYAVLPLYSHASLKLGRQEIVFDNQRLVGNVDWVQRARSFDGARATWRMDDLDADLFGVVITESDQDPDGHVPGGNSQVNFGGAHGTYRPADALSVSGAFFARKNNAIKEKRYTAGLFAQGKAAGAHYSGEYYYQFGDLDGEGIGAMLAAARAGYTADVAMKPGLTVWGEYLSGDGKPTGVFDTLYPTNHQFYGEMDFFLDIPAHTANLGLMDIGGRASLKPSDTVSAHVDYHLFQTVEADPAGEKALGSEINAKIAWKATDLWTVRTVYGVFLPGNAIKTVRGLKADPEKEHFGYLTSDVKF